MTGAIMKDIFTKLNGITWLGNCYVDDNDFISEHELAQAKFMRIPKKKDIADANEELYQMRKKYHQVGAVLEITSFHNAY